MKKLLFVLMMVAGLTSVSLVAQTNPAVKTTNSVLMNGTQTTITLTATTGIADNVGIYIDGEFMTVNPIWTSGNPVPVIRGKLGTTQRAHGVSQDVIIGPPDMFDTEDVGKGSSTCPAVPSNYLVSVNVISGNVWFCRYIGAVGKRIWTGTNTRLLTYNSLTIS